MVVMELTLQQCPRVCLLTAVGRAWSMCASMLWEKHLSWERMVSCAINQAVQSDEGSWVLLVLCQEGSGADHGQ